MYLTNGANANTTYHHALPQPPSQAPPPTPLQGPPPLKLQMHPPHKVTSFFSLADKQYFHFYLFTEG